MKIKSFEIGIPLSIILKSFSFAVAREATCAEDAGVVGCKLIDYTKDPTACDWAHTLETVVNEAWGQEYKFFLQSYHCTLWKFVRCSLMIKNLILSLVVESYK